jgi:uncharacterized protein YcfJ
MNKSILTLIAASALAACTGQDPAARAGESLDGAPDSNASSGQLAQASVGQNCYEVQVERAVEPGDEKKIAGTAIGAVVGGAIGKELSGEPDGNRDRGALRLKHAPLTHSWSSLEFADLLNNSGSSSCLPRSL